MTSTRRAEAFELVYTRLREAARQHGRVFHAELSGLIAPFDEDPDSPVSVSDILRQVAAAEHRAGRPLLTALVVTGKSVPGNVFFASARELGVLTGSDPVEEMRFWMDEERRVYEAWVGHAGSPA
jgi:hypothetical protein